MREHTIVLGSNSNLAFCTTCKGGEGSLTTECCGRPMTAEEEHGVYEVGDIDFVDGAWRHKCPKCGAAAYDEGGMFLAILKCSKCKWTDGGAGDAYCDLITTE